ncbi:MAG TPA: RNA-binding protein [Candidatus Paceibacterota bacterium]
MSKKLYVGGISYNTNNDGLRDAFSKAGTVEDVAILTDKMTGKSRGFGFVTMADEAAQAAIDMWHGKELDGRTLTVNEARPMAPRSDRPSRGGSYDRGDRRSF